MNEFIAKGPNFTVTLEGVRSRGQQANGPLQGFAGVVKFCKEEIRPS